MIDLLLGTFYLKLLSIHPGMFYIFPFDDRDRLENIWHGAAQRNPVTFSLHLTEPQLERLLAWAVGSDETLDEAPIAVVAAFCRRRRRRRSWTAFFQAHRYRLSRFSFYRRLQP